MKKGKFLLFIVLFVLLGVVAANAAKINVSPGPGTPLQDAINAANNGDILLLAAGTFTEQITINGREGLTIQGAGKETTFIDGTGGTAVSIYSSEDITLKNLSVINSADDNIYVDDVHWLTLMDIVSRNAVATGGNLSITGDSVIKNCEFTNNGFYGLYFNYSNYYFNIDSNLFAENGWDGLFIDEATQGKIYRNQFMKNGENGLYFYWGNNVKIMSNWADGNGLSGFNIYARSNYDVIVQSNEASFNGNYGFYGNEGILFMNNYAQGNSNGGIYAYWACIIKKNIDYDNGGEGIDAWYGSSVLNSLAELNAVHGIYSHGYGAMVKKNKMLGNQGGGLYNGDNMLQILNNFVDSNIGYGIVGGATSILTKSNKSTNNDGGGISDGGRGCTTMNNLSTNNTNAGIQVFSGDVYLKNKVVGNLGDGFLLVAGFNLIERNTVQNNGGNGINGGTQEDNLIIYNKVFGSGGYDLYETGGVPADNIWVNNKYGTSNFLP